MPASSGRYRHGQNAMIAFVAFFMLVGIVLCFFGIYLLVSLRNRVSILEKDMRALRRSLGRPLKEDIASDTLERPYFKASDDTPVDHRTGPADIPASDTIEKDVLQPDTAAPPQWDAEWIEPAEQSPHAAARTEQPRDEQGPLGASAGSSIRKFFSGGSMLVKVGVLVLFIGVSFLVKYAAEHDLFPIELRLSAAAIGGIVLLLIGWRLRLNRAAYAHVLQGGGVGIIYLTTFAALRLYGLIPPSLAFPVLVAVAVLSALLAVLQDSRSLAVLGATGGFLAPVLTSTGSENHVFLFGFYALLNLGIAGIAWFRAWRILNLVGFFFTFIIGLVWGLKYYRPEYLSTTEPFLILFFLLYTFIAVLFALRQPPNLKGYLDATLIFGTPITAFGLQAMLVEPYHFGLAWSAVALGFFYLPLAWFLYIRKPLFMRMLTEAFFAFGLIFGTLAIPLALDNRWTSAAWALEGAAILWAGLRQKRRLVRAFGIMLQFAAGVAFLLDMRAATGSIPILNGFYLGCALVALSGIFSAYFIHNRRDSAGFWDRVFGNALLIWGLIWWFSGGLVEIDRHVGENRLMGIVLVFLSLSSGVCAFLKKRLAWSAIAWPAMALLPAMMFCGIMMVSQNYHPFERGGAWGWPAAFAVFYLILSRNEDLKSPLLSLLHAGTMWLGVALVTLELAWRINDRIAGSPVWPLAVTGLLPALTALVISTVGLRLPWPVARHRDLYITLVIGPLIFFSWLWVLYVNLFSPGDPEPLQYLPLLNPLDLVIGLVLFTMLVWMNRLKIAMPDMVAGSHIRRLTAIIFCATLFAWLNGILWRTVHHWSGIPFTFYDLYHSVLLQAAMSISWSLLALCAMVYATQKRLRFVWLSGAALLGAVVLKLFLVDLSGTGTVARIVSFVGVGILLLVIGYFSPVPPRNQKEENQ